MVQRHATSRPMSYPNTPQHIKDAITEYVPNLDGWLLPERGIEMADAIFETKPKICVELGVFGGRSLISQAFALREINEGGVAVGIDPWRVEDALDGEQDPANRDWWTRNIDIEAIHRGAMRAIWDHHIEPWTAIIRSASQHVAPIIGEIGFLFIDGNHSETASLRDVELWVPKVKSGGYIFVDDADWPSTQRAYTRLREMADVVRVGAEHRDGGTQANRYLVCRKK